MTGLASAQEDEFNDLAHHVVVDFEQSSSNTPTEEVMGGIIEIKQRAMLVQSFRDTRSRVSELPRWKVKAATNPRRLGGANNLRRSSSKEGGKMRQMANLTPRKRPAASLGDDGSSSALDPQSAQNACAWSIVVNRNLYRGGFQIANSPIGGWHKKRPQAVGGELEGISRCAMPFLFYTE